MLFPKVAIIAFLCCLHSINGLTCPMQNQCVKKENPFIYHKLMTSLWLQDNAAINGIVLDASMDILHLKPAENFGNLLRVPILSFGELSACEEPVVYVHVFLKDPPTADSDLLVSICDGTERNCNGVYISDSKNYPDAACNYVSFKSGDVQGDPTFSGSCGGIPIDFETSPNAVTLTFTPSQQGASFHITPDGGYTTVGPFTNTLDPTQGLFLELYGAQTREEYLLQYIVVEVKGN